MGKGIIVLDDMPENVSDCMKCLFSDDFCECLLQNSGKYKETETWEDVFSGCPIKSLSKEVEMQLFREGKM